MIDADLQLGPAEATAQATGAGARRLREQRPRSAKVRELAAGLVVDDALTRAAALDAEPAPHANVEADRRPTGRIARRGTDAHVDAVDRRPARRRRAGLERLVGAHRRGRQHETETDDERGPHARSVARGEASLRDEPQQPSGLADGAGSSVTLSYQVGGYIPVDIQNVAPSVDAVLAEQMTRLKAAAEKP